MKTIEEAKEWLIENRTDEDGVLDLSGLNFSDFNGKVKGRIIFAINDLDSLNEDFRKMSPAEKGYIISRVFADDDGTIRIEDVDLSSYRGDVMMNRWTIDGNLSQCCHRVGGDLFQDNQEVKGSIYQHNQKAGCNLYQDMQEAGGCIVQDKQEAKDEPVHKDESKCVAPDYEGECERLRKELAKANRKNEILLWALDKALEEGE